MNRKRPIVILALALLGGVSAWYLLGDSAASSALTDLDATSFAELKNEFNAAAGRVRVIALLSPT